MLWLKRGEVVSCANNGSGCDQNEDADQDQSMRSRACSAPFMKSQPPQVAEHDDERHVDRPTRKVIFPHLRRAHAVEQKLKVPRDPCQGRKKVVAEDGSGATVDVVATRFIFDVQKQAPDTVGGEAAREDDDKDLIVLPDRSGSATPSARSPRAASSAAG